MAVVSQGSFETSHPPHKETPHKVLLPEAIAEVSQCFSFSNTIESVQPEFAGLLNHHEQEFTTETCLVQSHK